MTTTTKRKPQNRKSAPKRKRATKAEVRKIAQKAGERAQASAAVAVHGVRTVDDHIAKLGKPPTADQVKMAAQQHAAVTRKSGDDSWARAFGLTPVVQPWSPGAPSPQRRGTPTEEAEAIREHRIHRAVRPTLWRRMCGAVRGLFA